MSSISNKITGVQTQTDFTAKVIQDNSPLRYGNSSYVSTVFTVGAEYTGVNIYKGGVRPPKLRILSVFKPLINGTPNANNDTYVAFSVYDYTLGRFRGPACRRTSVNDSIVYNDFYLTTIDKFGKNYGNVYTGLGGTISQFTAPQVNFSTTLSTTLKSGLQLTIASGHFNGCFILGSDGTSIDFNGFISLNGLSGNYCFYTIVEPNGVPKEFKNTPVSDKYKNNTYPYLLPVTGKYVSEWRCSPICNLDNASFTPLVRPNNMGGIKYSEVGTDFGEGLTSTVDVWMRSDWTDYLIFFTRPLFADAGGDQGRSGYAVAGYYGPSIHDAYAYWDGNGNWGPITEYGGGAPTLNAFSYSMGYPDSGTACVDGPNERKPKALYATSFRPGSLLFADSAGTTPVSLDPNSFYYNAENAVVFAVTGNEITFMEAC